MYSADKLDQQLSMAAASFCGQEVEIIPEEKASFLIHNTTADVAVMGLPILMDPSHSQ